VIQTTLAPETVGLTRHEYDEITRRLGRDPSALELMLFGVMWSEHCGYKHSKLTLRSLPGEGPRLLQGPGENAGVMDIGGGWAVAFKMESHNHPSAVDPYNGAATGIGGIIRDVLSMGARPIALLDSLRFGPLADPAVARLARGVVAGIAGYGNCVGVPTVGGEIHTDPRYRGNPLVNVACLGLVRARGIARSSAAGKGNAVLYVGARTGRDGIGGAAFASEELDEDSEREDRSSVQIGDPFTGKLLIEATLEALASGDVVAIQDMGAAGLTCAASEMAARGGAGMRVDLDAVPLRESRMRPDEILRSESQERMLLVVRPEAVAALAAIFHRWGLAASVIGEVTTARSLVVTQQDRVIVDLPPYALAEAPAYRPAAEEPVWLRAQWTVTLPAEGNPEPSLLHLMASPDIASKRAVFQQYDHSVQVRTVVGPGGGDAAVLRVQEVAPKGIALTVAGNGRLSGLDPYRGARLAVAECAAGLSCVGAEPMGLTDCLNFGSPERPEVFWTFRRSVAGIADACRALRIPVVGGNVSFYNESADGPIPPTPVVAMVGLVEDVSRVCGTAFHRGGELVVLVDGSPATLEGSAYLQVIHGLAAGRPPDVDLDVHRRVTSFVRDAVREGWVSSAHDCADGGVAVALAESALSGNIGVEATVPAAGRRDTALFGEGPSRFILSVSEDATGRLRALADERGIPLVLVGRTGGVRVRIRSAGVRDGQPDAPGRPEERPRDVGDPARRRDGMTWDIDLSLDRLARAYDSLSRVFG
jgi:phosphoribosylformylglycinamidine synthase II